MCSAQKWQKEGEKVSRFAWNPGLNDCIWMHFLSEGISFSRWIHSTATATTTTTALLYYAQSISSFFSFAFVHFGLLPSTVLRAHTCTRTRNLHYRLYLTYDSILLHLFVNSNSCSHTPSQCTQAHKIQSHLDAVNFSCRCKEHFTTQIKCMHICVCIAVL